MIVVTWAAVVIVSVPIVVVTTPSTVKRKRVINNYDLNCVILKISIAYLD